MSTVTMTHPAKRTVKPTEKARAAADDTSSRPQKRKATPAASSDTDTPVSRKNKKAANRLSTSTFGEKEVPPSMADDDDDDEISIESTNGLRDRSLSVVELDGPPGPETAEAELSASILLTRKSIFEFNFPERLQNDWSSTIYAFFEPTPTVREIQGRRVHEFKCAARGCQASIRRYLDTKDAKSTGNMRKHVRTCWGNEVLDAADEAKDVTEVRTKIVKSIIRNGSITTAFECKGNGKVTYSHRSHTKAETR